MDIDNTVNKMDFLKSTGLWSLLC